MNAELFQQMADEVTLMMEQGGFVMWPLAVATALLWFGIGYRATTLTRGSRRSVRDLIEQYRESDTPTPRGFVDAAALLAVKVSQERRKQSLRRLLDDRLFFLEERLSRFRVLVRTIVVVAPLAGLLGTVAGMIEMFQSLGDQTFYSQSGGVANGISQALFTTQFGLAVAIPGMIVGRLMDRRENQFRQEIEQIKEVVYQGHSARRPA